MPPGIITRTARATSSALCLLALAASLGLTRASHASPLELFGVGPRSAAMAGAGAASSGGFEAVYINPAGLADERQKFLTLGAAFGRMNLQIDGERTPDRRTGNRVIGAVLPLGLGGAMKDRLTFGIAAMVPNSTIARAKSPKLGDPSFALLASRGELVGVNVGLGYRFRDHLHFGFGFLTTGTLEGSIFIDVDGAGRFVTKSEQKLIADPAPIIGMRYHMRSMPISIGLSARGASAAGYDIEVTNALGETLPITLPVLQIVGTPQYDPAAVHLEVSHRLPNPDLLVSMQLDYKHWSGFSAPAQNPVDGQMPVPDPGFTNTINPTLSAEWLLKSGDLEVAARGGYSFVMSPAPEMRGQQSLFDNHRHKFGVGLGLVVPNSVQTFHVDLWSQAHILMKRTHEKDPSEFPGGEVPFEQARTKGNLIVGGISLGVPL